MHADLEALSNHHRAQIRRHNIFAFGYKIKGRAKTISDFKIHQPLHARQAFRAFHVMGQHERKLLSLRPSRPSWRSRTRVRVYRPYRAISFAASGSSFAPQCQAQLPWYAWFQEVIDSVQHRDPRVSVNILAYLA